MGLFDLFKKNAEPAVSPVAEAQPARVVEVLYSLEWKDDVPEFQIPKEPPAMMFVKSW